MRAQIQAVDSTLPVFGARTLDDTVSSSLDGIRFSMRTVTLFGLTALLLASIGIYGVMANIVGGRAARSASAWRSVRQPPVSCGRSCAKAPP